MHVHDFSIKVMNLKPEVQNKIISISLNFEKNNLNKVL